MRGKGVMLLMAIWLPLVSGVCQNAQTNPAADTTGADSRQQMRRISPTGALLRSAFVPGWGQVHNRKYAKALLFASAETWLAYGVVKDWRETNRHEANFKSASDPDYQASEFERYKDTRDRRNLKMWFLAAAIFYSMFDAYVDAQLSDFEQKDKAFEVNVMPNDGLGLEIAFAFRIK